MKKVFPATTEGMSSCLCLLEEMFVSPKPKIIMDEVVSNIVRCSGASEFAMSIDNNGDGTMSMVFTDDGTAFDPTDASTPDITAPIAEREIGGLGLFMVKKMSKAVAYERKDGKNVLTVVLNA